MADDYPHDASAGRFPPVEDDAAASAPWLPWLGLGVLVFTLLYGLATGVASDEESTAAEGSAEVDDPSP